MGMGGAHRSGATWARSTVFCLLVWLGGREREAERARRAARLTQMTSHVSASVNCSVLLVRMLRAASEAVDAAEEAQCARLLASAKPKREWSVNTACA